VRRRAPTRRPRSRLGFRIGATVLVVGILGLVAEAIAQRVAPQVPTWHGNDNGGVIMVGHPTRLWSIGSGVRRNADTTATISPVGLREPVPEGPRPAGRQRVLVLGDSTFFGHGVPDGGTLEAQLQGLLRARGVDVEVINGGIPGYSTEQTRMLLDDVGWSLEPTLLLIGNVWSDNNFDHFSDADLLRTRAALADNPLGKSAFFQILAGAVDRARGGPGAHIVTWTHGSSWPTSGKRRVPVQRYAANLDAMIRDAAARNVGAVLFRPSNLHLVTSPDDPDVVWGPYHAAQAAVAAHHGLPLVETLPRLLETVATVPAEQLFLDDMHPTVAGHGVFAAAAAAALAAADWPARPLLGRSEPYDPSGLVDGTPTQITTNPLSPQANLFTAAYSGGSPAQAPTAAGPQDGSWYVTGKVEAAGGPVRIEVRKPSGEPLGVTVLAEPGGFRLRVRGELDTARVVATGPDGRTAEVEAAREGAELSLRLAP
jgi:lysophospholipase L1-like esterase